MSLRQQLEDPTGLKDVGTRLSYRYQNQITGIEGSLLAQLDMDDALFQNLAANALTNMLLDIAFPTQVSMNNAIMRTALELRTMNPLYRMGDYTWLPIDTAKFNEFTKAHENDVKDMMHDFEVDIAETVQQGEDAGLSWQQIGDNLREVFKLTKQRANTIARTTIIHSYNETTRNRYELWGINEYIFHAHIGACTEPKTLSDGSIVKGGCMELHNKVFPITDTVHLPPIHPLGRCTILPKQNT